MTRKIKLNKIIYFHKQISKHKNKLKKEYRKLDHKNLEFDIEYCLRKLTNSDLNNCINHSFKFINNYK